MNTSLPRAVLLIVFLGLLGSCTLVAQTPPGMQTEEPTQPETPVSEEDQQTEVKSIEVFFLPEDGNDYIVDFLREASVTVCLVANVITRDAIAKELLQAKDRGVEVKVLMDGMQVKNNQYSQHWFLMENGIEIKVIGPESGRMIGDFGIIDTKCVYVGGGLLHSDIRAAPKIGSCLVIRNDHEMVDKFKLNFLRLYEEAAVPFGNKGY